VHEASNAKIAAEARLKRLQDHRSAGGASVAHRINVVTPTTIIRIRDATCEQVGKLCRSGRWCR
jgi:hypothetical protein